MVDSLEAVSGTQCERELRKRILFVDDEPAILASLQKLLRKDSLRWDMVFVLSGQQALDEIRKVTFHVVVSDMMMPEIDGATLLNAVKTESPATMRILLTGYSDAEALACVLPALHQLLSKPCSIASLRDAIECCIDDVDE